MLTIFVDGCTDFLWDKAVPNPKFAFRITNIQSADGVTCAVAAAQTWPTAKKIAHIHPDYSYGRNAFDHFMIAYKKMVPGAEVVSEAWPKLGTTDFTAHITKTISSNPDLIMSSVWGGDYVALYKQALRTACSTTPSSRARSPLASRRTPSARITRKASSLVSTPITTSPSPGKSLAGQQDLRGEVFQALERYPNFQSDGAYHTLHMYRTAVEKANRLVGGWPDEEAIISQLEGMYFETAAGYLYIRPDNHQGYKDAVTGFSKNVAEYPFQILDPGRMITIPIRNITAPPNWPKPGTSHNDPTSTYNWIKETWPQDGLKLAHQPTMPSFCEGMVGC